jgi:ComF family protein
MFASKLVGLFTRLGWKVDLVIPVPLGRLRQHQRGYNQSDLIARSFAGNIGLEYEPLALGRTRETSSQVSLELSERENNVHGAFATTSARIKGRRVLLIDDIATTCATLSACADALLAADVPEVLALTVARAI